MARSPKKKFDVFLSHSHLDAFAVEQLGEQLEDLFGFRVWLDRWILVPGNHWQQEMARGLKEAKTCAVFIGSQTPKGWFREEVERALNLQVSDQSFRVIPVLLPNASTNLVDNFLELRTWIIFEKSIREERGLHDLAAGIRGIPPGRPSRVVATNEFDVIKDKLLQIRELRRENLIDDDVAIEFQKRILERI